MTTFFQLLLLLGFVLAVLLAVPSVSFTLIQDKDMDEGRFDAEESKINSTLRNSHQSKIDNNDTKKPGVNVKLNQLNKHKCKLSLDLIAEIASYQLVADLILATILNGPFKGRTYNELAIFTERFGSRFTGTTNLEDSIDYMLKKMESDQLENVHGEDVTVPRWIRGEESAELISPKRKKLAILGLGPSIGTPKEGIRAEVLVVKSFNELKQKAEQAKGKIIVFNGKFTVYNKTASYRYQGAIQAAKVGGVASLVRSITPSENNIPHVGLMHYDKHVTQIPSAALGVQDAQFLQECQDKSLKIKIVIHLKMNDFMLPPSKSRNVIGELVGHEFPQEVVIVSGHIDSWDVGVGAMDDGGGVFISEEALALLKFLNLRPKRTLRSILWTGEEVGQVGGNQYVRRHQKELNNFNAMMESDLGTFKPVGLDLTGSQDAGCIVQEVLKLLASINATTLRIFPRNPSDKQSYIHYGVPALGLNTMNGKYFWYHHSGADTMAVEDPDDLDLCLAVWATVSYVISDLSVSLPRK